MRGTGRVNAAWAMCAAVRCVRHVRYERYVRCVQALHGREDSQRRQGTETGERIGKEKKAPGDCGGAVCRRKEALSFRAEIEVRERAAHAQLIGVCTAAVFLRHLFVLRNAAPGAHNLADVSDIAH